MKPILSIITPTYNRKELLLRCFDSLKKQTCFDFQWIIVDDGSTDGTCEIADQFVSENFEIQYLYKENGGKHTALNFTHPYINGDFVTILDNDDYFLPNAVENIVTAWKTITDPEIGIVSLLKGKREENGEIVPLCTGAVEGQAVDIAEGARIRNISSDCNEVIRKDLFLKYPFPIFEGERFVSECALWDRVGQTHKCVYFNNIVCICEYLEDGLTGAGRKMRLQNPNGGMFTSNLRMSKNNRFKIRIKNGLLYTCYGFFAHKSPCAMAEQCQSKCLMWCCLPMGWLLYKYWNKKYRMDR